MGVAVRNEGKKVNSNINVTPMVDVMLVLLIIFMVITPMLQQKVQIDMAQVEIRPPPTGRSGRAHRLSAVNSINIARVLAQCVYYLHAWLRLPGGHQRAATFVVPTGNFGNVLAGWMLQKMGVPIRGFRVATNRNDILHRLSRRASTGSRA